MNTKAIRIALMVLIASFIGVQGVDAQDPITKPVKPEPSNNSGGKKPGRGTTPATKKDAMTYVTITGISIGNVTYDGDMITYYGNTLYENEMKYAKPRLTYNCTKAANADITVSGTANRLKENIQKAQANQAANERARRAYEEFIARQKAEEDFWTRGVKK